MKRVLVTGADGFIGSHLVEGLLDRGYLVKGLAQYNSFGRLGWLEDIKSSNRDNLQIISGDIRDPFFVNDIVQECNAVLHLAALIAIPHSYISPSSYLETNVMGTLNVLNACKIRGDLKVVCTSSSEIYGSAQYVPIDELHPINAQSPYAASKIGADQLALSYIKSFDLPISIVRPFNTYGPRQSNRAVIPSIICQIVNGAKEIYLGDVTPTRDFSYVTDTVNGFIQMLEIEPSISEIINLGSDFEISIEKVVRLVSDIVGYSVRIKKDSQRLRPKNSEVNRLLADTEKAKKLLNWAPEFAGEEGFKRGLEKTVEWFQNPKNLEKYKTFEYIT
jgi:dTDP-glucose 4,6-dehydratase